MKRRVVVTGLGALTPIGHNVADFEQNLIAGHHGIDFISRYDTSDSKFKLAAEIKDYDPLKRLDKAVVRKTDIYVQYALYAAAEAMEQSALAGKIEADRLGVYFGSGIGGLNSLTQEYDKMITEGPKKVSSMLISKMIVNIAAGNIAIAYGAKGPCLPISTACATGTSAIGEGYRAILHDYADAVICGGSEASIHPLAISGFGNSQALTQSEDPNLASLPFDERRGGFVIAEGAGALVLEELSHAQKRGATILAEIVGYGSTCDAHHVTAPDPEAEAGAAAIAMAYAPLKNIYPKEIYFNAHGTGTPLNDVTETMAIKRALGSDKASLIHISSSKSVLGHMLGAAGAVEAIAAIIALNRQIVPPTAGLHQQDPLCDLNYTPLKALATPLRGAFSNSLGFGGHNACLSFKVYKN